VILFRFPFHFHFQNLFPSLCAITIILREPWRSHQPNSSQCKRTLAPLASALTHDATVSLVVLARLVGPQTATITRSPVCEFVTTFLIIDATSGRPEWISKEDADETLVLVPDRGIVFSISWHWDSLSVDIWIVVCVSCGNFSRSEVDVKAEEPLPDRDTWMERCTAGQARISLSSAANQARLSADY
jgi:hypothetical protein